MHKRSLVSLILASILAFTAACTGRSVTSGAERTAGQSSQAERLGGYSIKGNKFAYYKVPSGIPYANLIGVAQQAHDSEPNTQLMFVDDDSQIAEYIEYVKAVSGPGDVSLHMPSDWAEKHIVANVQKYMSGKFVLCKGNGNMEIADLK